MLKMLKMDGYSPAEFYEFGSVANLTVNTYTTSFQLGEFGGV